MSERRIIPGYPRYEVSDDGSIFNRENGRQLKLSKQSGGYLSVELFKEPGKSKRVLVHRLVAMAFIENPNNLPVVNHKDANRSNNQVSNLEWCTGKYNVNYGDVQEKKIAHTQWFYKSERIKETARTNGRKSSKPVEQLSKDGCVISFFSSGKIASVTTGINHSHIMECCAGKRKTAGGYIWKYTGGQ